jgi:hypothetical protein
LYSSSDRDENDRACSKNGREEKCIQSFCGKTRMKKKNKRKAYIYRRLENNIEITDVQGAG